MRDSTPHTRHISSHHRVTGSYRDISSGKPSDIAGTVLASHSFDRSSKSCQIAENPMRYVANGWQVRERTRHAPITALTSSAVSLFDLKFLLAVWGGVVDTPIFRFMPTAVVSVGAFNSGASCVGVPVRLLVVLLFTGDVELSGNK